jgi:tetratricopeptide (TPR) repeat protein
MPFLTPEISWDQLEFPLETQTDIDDALQFLAAAASYANEAYAAAYTLSADLVATHIGAGSLLGATAVAGSSALHMNRPEDALSWFSSMALLDGSSFQVLAQNGEAICWMMMGKPHRALVCCRQALEHGDHQVVLVNMANAYLQMGNPPAAEAAYDRLCQPDPVACSFVAARCSYHLANGDPRAAAATAEEALRDNGPEEYLRLILSLCYARMGEYSRALEQIGPLQKTAAGQSLVDYVRSSALWSQGKLEEAIAGFNSVVASYPALALETLASLQPPAANQHDEPLRAFETVSRLALGKASPLHQFIWAVALVSEAAASGRPCLDSTLHWLAARGIPSQTDLRTLLFAVDSSLRVRQMVMDVAAPSLSDEVPSRCVLVLDTISRAVSQLCPSLGSLVTADGRM